MSCSAIKAKGIPYEMERVAEKAADDVIYTLELWCIWGSSTGRETVDDIHDIRAVMLHNM